MGIGSRSVDFIRQFFTSSEYNRPPFIPLTAFGSVSNTAPYFSYGMSAGSLQGITDYLRLDGDLVARYIDAEDQDDSPLISSGIDIYADDSTQVDPQEQTSIWVESDDEDVRSELDHLLHKVLKVEETIWGTARTLWKYGNNFMEIVAKDGVGVVALNMLPPPTVRRIEVPRQIGIDPNKPEEEHTWDTLGFIYDPRGVFKITTKQFIDELKYRATGEMPKEAHQSNVSVFESWEMVHMRLLGKNPYSPYGHGVGEPARWIFKRLMLLEDSIILHRLTRAPSRFAFYIDVSGIPPNETQAYLNRVKQGMKKQKFVNPNSNKLDQKYNVLCLALNTRIPLLNGQTKELKDLIKDHESGVKNYVYSFNTETGKIVPGEVSWAGVTKKNAELVRVTLDSCQTEVVTPDHRFLMRDGTYKQAKDLKSGDSLMPCYRSINTQKDQGREYVTQPGVRGWKAMEYTHKMVASHFHGSDGSLDIHHKDENKRNNYPENLELLTREKHLKIHSKNLVAYNKSEAKRIKTAEDNRKYNKGKNIVAYNNSEQHSKDNEIRSKSLTSLFANRRDEMISAMTLEFPESTESFLKSVVQKNPKINMVDFTQEFNSSDLCKEFTAMNTRDGQFRRHPRASGGISRNAMLAMLKRKGYEGFSDFKEKTLYNHKVASVEFLTHTEDTGCITVPGWKNFALDSGVFVHNSSDEDFFMATRDGKESSRVESLQGPIYDAIEDIKYFENKLFAAIKVPKPFLTYEESTAKTNLSAEDARFARTVLRGQREMRNGYKKVCQVHLASKGIDPNSVEFDVCMTIPSAIFELAQLEIRAAELDLASKYDGWANRTWVKQHVLGWSDEQIREAWVEDDGEMPSSGGTGDLEKALSKRGSPSGSADTGEEPAKAKAPSPAKEAPPKAPPFNPNPATPETASKKPARKADVVMSSIQRNTEKLLERLEFLQDKTSDKKWDEIGRTLKELRHTVDRVEHRSE